MPTQEAKQGRAAGWGCNFMTRLTIPGWGKIFWGF